MSNETQLADTVAGLPTRAYVQHAADALVASVGKTNSTRFMFSGISGHPDFFEYTASRGDSPPLHSHPWASLELILEGRIRYVVDEEEFTAETGDFVYTPPNAAHTFVVESETARMVGYNHPSPRFAELQERAAPLFDEPGGPDMQRLGALADQIGIKLLGPPLEVRA